ncbi:lysophospholipid acyltransferase family protein [Herbaspirillum sp. RTI4]|uniref:lysophospholipid acyltransferase family protein n=1 Tax=Herbaspirillum sp. RTI4 TaxID=3048640 RepID=UPI002AB50E39|nr:lysophospholipid acyltransferase family protein [Herbaspirillum sp. RTI4]MDY7578935.1 lysophospholipid acyltransferase family protein [Herbaspirillum sp. RTI4]MEA9982024.1 lysophospholipid acyltransferase family protein [Herbaspirillum sp. RTI4]
MLEGCRRTIDQSWRIVGTGLSFVAFGLGGLLWRVGICPLMDLTVRDPQRRAELARESIGLSFRIFINVMRFLGVIRYRISGLERLQRRGLLIIANHPTLIDTVFLMAFAGQTNCIINNSLWNNPFMRGPLRTAGYLRNNHGPELMADCMAILQAGGNLIIFPEGSRTPTDGQIRFKRGAANLAVRGGFDVTPAIIRCTPATLSKGGKWWQVPATVACFDIQIQADIETHPIVSQQANPAMAARHLSDYLQTYFIQESQVHATT